MRKVLLVNAEIQIRSHLCKVCQSALKCESAVISQGLLKQTLKCQPAVIFARFVYLTLGARSRLREPRQPCVRALSAARVHARLRENSNNRYDNNNKCIYIYIYRYIHLSLSLSLYIYIYIYIHMYVFI